MKLKLTLMAVAATLALGYQAQALPSMGIVTNYSKINVGIIAKTNVFSENGSHEKQKIKSVKITNKYLLNLFAAWYDVENTNEVGTTVWPDGAQLVQGWDENTWDGDVLVVDKTGTNVLYDATTTANSSTHYFEFYDEYIADGAYSYDELDADPGFYDFQGVDSGEVYLYDDDFYLDYTYFWIYYTPFTSKFNEKWNADDQYTTWSQSGTIQTTGSDFDFLDESASTTGTITESGHGVGFNEYWGD